MNGRKKPDPDRMRTVAARRGRYLGYLGSSAIGITLAGYIVGSVVIGYFLDAHFRTSFWTPLLLILGAFGGFRDMIQTLNKVSRQEKTEREAARTSAELEHRPTQNVSGSQVIQPELIEESDRPKPRIFAVPPPPQASFDKQREEPSGAELEPVSGEGETDSTTDLIEKLMSDDQTSSP